ncbi:sugar efflux transporter [Streptomyces sp. NPDC004065]|uniref:sugar efflux transporter n=1 Tax=Streptomyces sp. NPDC004065 TaxID=3364689 RepID=UPI003850FEF2
MKLARPTPPVHTQGAPQGRRFGRTATSLGVAAGCHALAMSVFGTTLSLFLADAVGAGPGLIGLYFTGCAVAGIGINLAMGRLSDRLPDRRIALASTALAGSAGALILTGARTYAVVFATGAVLLGLNEAYISQLFAYVKEFADTTGREVTPFSSAVRSVFSAGWVVGPPVGLFLLTHAGFARMYAVAAALLVPTVVLGRWFLPALQPPPRPEPDDRTGNRRPALRRALTTVPPRSWLLLGSVTAVNVANQMYLITIALHVTKDLRLPASLVGLMAGACAALEIPLMITVGRLADRVGKVRIMAAAVALAVVFFCLLPMARSAPALLALQLPNAMWIAVITSIPMVVVQQEVPGGTGTVSALYSSTFPVAQLLAGAITGVVAAQAGYRSVFWICAGLCALAAVLLLLRRRAAPLVPAGQGRPDRPDEPDDNERDLT